MYIIIMLLAALPLCLLWQYKLTEFRQPCSGSISSPASMRGWRWNNPRLILFGVLACLPLYLIYSLQYDMHVDYQGYYRYYINLNTGGSTIREPAANVIFRIIDFLGLPFHSFYIILYAISFIVLFKCIHDYSSLFAASIVIFAELFFVLSFIQTRQFAAVVIAFYAYRFIAARKPLPFFALIALACAFHISAVIMLPMYFIFRIRFRLSHYIVIAVCSGFMNLFQTSLIYFITNRLLTQYSGRHEMFRRTVINPIDVVAELLLLFIVLVYMNNKIEINETNRIFITAFFFQFIAFFTCRWIPEFDRFSYYFYFPVIALLPNLIASDKKSAQRQLMQIFVLVILLLLFLWKYRNDAVLAHYISIFSK